MLPLRQGVTVWADFEGGPEALFARDSARPFVSKTMLRSILRGEAHFLDAFREAWWEARTERAQDDYRRLVDAEA